MSRHRIVTAGAVCAAMLGAAAIVAHAGPLNPPAGPVGPTMKTLADVEPRIPINAQNTPGDADSLFKISQAGSYCLTGNVTGEAGKHGIEIAASGVSVDLMGFQLLGAAGSLDGIFVSASATNVAVRNGAVQNWGGDGVDMFASNNSMVEGLHVSANGGSGLRAGSTSLILNCVAASNVTHGVVTGTRCRITGCTSTGNGTGAGVGHGFSVSADCEVSDCGAFSNGLGSGGGNGIQTDTGCRVMRCTASSNGNASTTNNDGFRIGSGSMVIDCLAILNLGDGIQVAFQSLVKGNNCIANGLGSSDGAGILVTNSDNRIEDNNCTGADRGIDVNSSGNVIVRNVCSGNTLNWDVAANNVILVVNATLAGAVSGSSGGAPPGSTDPNANFTY